MTLALDTVSIRYGDTLACRHIDLNLPDGEFGCLLGPSGSGKTSLLRAIAGFTPLEAGQIHVAGRCLSTADMTVPAADRGVGMVFQDLALLPHLSVANNIAFGLARRPRSERRERLQQMLTLTGLAALADRHPHELSGGQQQRVAIARALAPAPRLILLDEPFSSLDSSLRLSLAAQVRDLIKSTGTTALMVTHDQQEAFALGDRIGVLIAGRLEQWDQADALYHRPASPFVGQFVGDGVLIPAQIGPDRELLSELGPLGRDPGDLPPGTAVNVLLRPEHLRQDQDGQITARIVGRQFRGPDTRYELALPSGQRLIGLGSGRQDCAIGQSLNLRLTIPELIVFVR